MLHVQAITRTIGARTLLDSASLTIGAGERVGLIGRNGCGKTTLLRILAGEEAPDSGGTAGVRRNLSIGYLPQIPALRPDRSVMDAAMEGLSPGIPEWRFQKALSGLGFSPQHLAQRVGTLSGGEKTRLLLARLLVGEHDLLLLDEPTSHLDIDMLRWLENYLASYRGAYLVVSHDRRFLDRAVSRILELDEGRLTSYTGGYSAYAAAKQAAIERQREDYMLQQRQIRALREFASRQLAWASQKQEGPKRGRDTRGRIAEKIAKRAHAAERRIEQMAPNDKLRDSSSVSARFAPGRRSGQIVFEARGIGKSVGGRELLSDASFDVRYGDRVGIIGPNGAGKTTLVRMLLGALESDSGHVRRGASVDPLYLAQEQEQLEPRKTVVESVQDAGGLSHTDARTLLACFLFRADEVFKRVGDLSGGERVRLAVACAVVSGANLLVLDEPTNYLDIDTRERLEDAIDAYPGTLLVVSHDRYLLDRLADRLLVIRERRVEDFAGRYSEWEERESEVAGA